MPFIDDTTALRNLPPAAAAAALGLRPDPEKQLDKGGKSGGSVFYRAPNGDLVICIPTPREAASPLWQVAGGRWTDCVGAVQQLQGLPTVGHAKAFLRRSISFPLPILSTPSNPTPAQPTTGIRLTACPNWAMEWLATTRGIGARTLVHAQELRLLAGLQRERFVNLAFPYTTPFSEVVGAEVRGLPAQAGARQFRGFEGARSEAFFILPPQDMSKPARAVVVVEAAIDALAFLDWSRQAGKPPAWVLATGGEPTTRQPAAMLDFCKEMGADLVVTAQDNDAAGASQAAKFGQAAEQAGMRHKRLTPPTGCKDWGEWASQKTARHAA
jgi:hypothetical protein